MSSFILLLHNSFEANGWYVYFLTFLLMQYNTNKYVLLCVANITYYIDTQILNL